MGKNGGSCFKIMTCGRDSEDNGEEEVAEGKIATDKRKWSFRRKSTKHQVLSNISISGPLSVESNSKGSPEASSNNFNEPTNFLQVSEKGPCSKHVEDKRPLPSIILDSTVSDTIDNENRDVGTSYQESVVIVIQSVVRRYLAHKELIKLKNVVKLQAIIRGYLVRRQAVGTLRCVQAIVKLQALVRARTQEYAKKLANLEESSGYQQKRVHSLTEKVQANAFSRQLLVSTPTKRSIYISCDPSKSASAWKWLERWMTSTSAVIQQQHELEQNAEFKDHREKDDELAISKATVEVTDVSFTADTEPDICEAEVQSKVLLNGFSHAEHQDPISESAKEFHKPTVKESSNIDMEEFYNSTSNEINVKLDANSDSEVHGEKRLVDIEKSKRTTKRMATEPPEIESKKSVIVPKRSCNPAFAAAQSKFEELSAAPTPGRSVLGRASSFLQVTVAESKLDSLSHPVENSDNPPNQADKSDGLSCEVASTTKSETNFSETNLSHQTQLQTAISECGTEISISSTLDSPDRSEAEGGEIVLEIGTLERRHFDANGNSNGTCILDHTNPEANVSSNSVGALKKGLSNANANDICGRENFKSETKNISATSEDFQAQKIEQAVGNSGNSISTLGPMLGTPSPVEQPKPYVHVQYENATGEQADMSSPSPGASPRSHITAPESHGTPASQVSGNVKSSQKHTNFSTKKLKSQLANKRSLSNTNNSGGRDSTEHSQEDSKNVKRRNSLGMVKPDFLDHEPRNSSSNSLPNYMQATESAKAKLHASTSPKSSPDVHDKEGYTKKHPSLPIGNGKQISPPRMQRSASQVQQRSKVNSKRSPNVAAERKWQR